MNRYWVGLNGRILLNLLFGVALLAACTTNRIEPAENRTELRLTLVADGESRSVATTATTVRELLTELSLELVGADEVEPPLFTPLTAEIDRVEVTRVTESIELIDQAVSFDRRIVRNEAMSADDAPIIIQAGQPGIQELTVRIVYRNGLEAERFVTQAVLIEPPQDEIVMVGLGAAPGNVTFAGTLAYISAGNSLILRGSTALPETLDTGGNLDRRVFSLSPTGSHLLYTRALTDTTRFNELMLLPTRRNAEPQSLGVDNVLWADWNPSRIDTFQVAYTTGRATDLLPGWEANNDLWLADLAPERLGEAEFEPEQIIEAYPATYGWWGGNYAWSPDGRYLAYSFADEVGLIDTVTTDEELRRTQLQRFTEYNTRADWVWVPSLTWSPDGRFLAFTNHGGNDSEALQFDSWVVDVESDRQSRFVDQTGIWGHMHWSPPRDADFDGGIISQIAFLRSTNPLDSLRSSYTLWLMDQDGSNAQQIFPPVGENSRFPRERQFMNWGPSGQDFAFVFNDDLYVYNLALHEAYRITQDDNAVSHPSWAPYGDAVTGDEAPAEVSR